MEKDTKKRNKIIGISLGIIAVIAIIAGSTYAYWQITKTQKNANDIVAACLNFTIENEIGAFGLEDAAPLSDEEGAKLNGYTFSVENKCDEAVTYIVGLDALENASGKYLSHDNLKVKLDNKAAKVYSSLKDAGNPNVLASKQLGLETVEGKGTNTHNVKIWIKSDAPVSEQGKGFTGQVFITGGQGIGGGNECFTIADNGTILGYDISCGTDVVVPPSINGIDVKSLNALSFNDYDTAGIVGGYGEESEYKGDIEYEYYDYIYYFKDEEIASNFIEMMKYEFCDDPENCDIDVEEALAENFTYIIVGVDEYNSWDWSKYTMLEIGEFMSIDFETMEMKTKPTPITSLDLSKATELEKIENIVVYGQIESETPINDTCKYDSSPGVYYCNGDFSTVIFPENGKLKEIGAYAFYGNKMTTLVIPDYITKIGEYAFENNAIENLVISENSQLKTIGKSAFERNKITSLTISVPNIEPSAFRDNKLTSVTIGNKVENIGSSAFYGSNEGNQIATLIFEDTATKPSKLTVISSEAFANNKLTELVTPKSLKSIGSYSFYNNDLTSIKLNEGLESISSDNGGWNAFSDNELTKVVIPSTVTNIGHYSFSANPNLTEIIIKRTQEDANANMTLASDWNWVGNSNYGAAYPVTYDPNYTE